jgi:hypothetical protein
MNPMHPSYTPSTSLIREAAQQRITSAAAPPAKRRLSINTSPTPPLTNQSKRTMQVYEEHNRKHKRQRSAARRAPILSRYNRHLAVLKHRRMGCPSNARMSKTAMAGPGNDPVQVYRTGLPLHWEFLHLWTGFELSSSWTALPCYGLYRNRNILEVMRWTQIALGAQALNVIQRPK